MSEKTFWIVQQKHDRSRLWHSVIETISYVRHVAVRKYEKDDEVAWGVRLSRGEVRCIKVRVVPVEGRKR